MTRLSAVARATVVITVGWVAVTGCGGGGDDYHTLQPGGEDAAVDDAGASDAQPDASANGADLAIAITGAPEPVAASSTLTYTIAVTNRGGRDATKLKVTHRLPSGNVAFLNATGLGWTCAAAGQLVTCTRDTLLVGAAPTITVGVTTPGTGGSLSSTAKVEVETLDPDLTNNEATTETVVLTPADLSIAITDSPDPVAAGGSISYAITVTNNGPGPSSGIAVLDTLPAGVAFVSASGTGWSCSATGQDVTCLSPALAATTSSAITLVTTAPTSGGTVTNAASVTAMTPDANQANNQASTSTTVNAAADLAIAIADSPDPVLGRGTLQYAIDVTNLGPNTASGITVTNGLPSGNVTFGTATGSGWTCSLASQVVTCTRPSLLVGAAPTITITVQAPSEATTLTDTVSVTSTSADLVQSNNTASAMTQVLSAANLGVAVIDAPDPVTTGGTLTYTVTASNAGPSVAADIVVTSTLAPGVGFQSATGTNWTCGAIGQEVTCRTPAMVVGAAPAITIATTAPGVDGPITTTSTIASATTDPVPANDTASQTTTVNAPSDLALARSASPSTVPARSTLTYTIAVTNLGPRDATNLVVTNRLPDGDVQYVNASGIGWACVLAGQIVTCTRPLLIVGAAPSIAIQIITPPAAGTLIDEASVTASTADLDLGNNTATDATDVFDSADLSIIASESPNPVRIGTDLTYTLNVANAGPTAAVGITVVDTLPAGTTFQSATGAGWACAFNGVVTCTMAGLSASSSAPAISIVATAPGTAGTITNTATVGSATSDPTPANNTASTDTLANAFADLSVVVTDTPDPITGSTVAGCTPTTCVTYSIDVSNAGPDTATSVRVVTTLPPNGTFFNAVGTGWVCPAPAGTLTCTRTSLAVGAAPTIVLTWKAPSPGGFSIVVSSVVSGSSTDPNTANNSATQDTTVNP